MPSVSPYCACATPPGASGIAVIRMAGEGSAEVIDRVFRLIRTSGDAGTVRQMPGYTAAYGVIYDPTDQRVIDEVVCTRFTSPHSYTGEDSVEISCHGGTAVRQEILRVLIANGARSAEPGEFTKNAFLAGKMDLSQAEAVMDVISSESTASLTAAESQLAGALKSRIRAISEDLYRIFAALEMQVEFPEHEDTPENSALAVRQLEAAHRELMLLAETFSQGRILKDGMGVVLGGIPNSGKSSLFNRLAGYDRAIVTATPGTTRDTLEVFTSVEGIPVRLEDTAGIRETEDEIEDMGVQKALEAFQGADLILWLCATDVAVSVVEDGLFSALATASPASNFGVVFSKSDLIREEDAAARETQIKEDIRARHFSDRIAFYCSVSSETKEGIASLGREILALYAAKGQGSSAGVILTNARHFEKVNHASQILRETVEIMRTTKYADMACSLLRGAMEVLGEITGDSVSDTLVASIFSRFCIGK